MTVQSGKSSLKDILLGILVLTALAAMLIGIWMLTETKFVLGLFGGAVTIILATYQYRKAKEREVEGRLFESKAEIYQGIADLVKTILLSAKGIGAPQPEVDLARRLIDYRARMIVWSSIETLEAYDQLSKMEGKDIAHVFTTMARLYECMRKDLGHRDPTGSGLKIMLGNITDASSLDDLIALSKH